MADDRKYYVMCADNCRFEAMTKEQVIAAIAEATGNTPTDIDSAFITKIKEINKGAAVQIWLGTTAEYNALETISDSVIYIKTDDTQIKDLEQYAAEGFSNLQGQLDTAKEIINEDLEGLADRITACEGKAFTLAFDTETYALSASEETMSALDTALKAGENVSIAATYETGAGTESFPISVALDLNKSPIALCGFDIFNHYTWFFLSDTILLASAVKHEHSCGFKKLLTADDDLNSIFEDGVYAYSTASVPANAPFANAAVIEIFGADSTTTQKIQRAYRYGAAGYSAFRPLFNSSWGVWTVTADSVIETGTTDGWNYRKWTSGKMEAWGRLSAEVTDVHSAAFTAQVKFPSGMVTGENNIEYCSLQARDYRIYGNMSGISNNNLWGRFHTNADGLAAYPVGSTLTVHAFLIGKWQ